ncbi:flagellin [Sulfitobacter sp. R18_1]|uniref:flagellin N-terminal helical domain-containing protein n=1 Tax=Sulfitobacter sp. R18_1 TaxID=2821104 RepID=UPI001ADBC108|nr:flagellin [Sulfitobacter sp. R18_1]MBO9428638.1 hypothetical protein [Sulfitobacter sp. R18_1]
MSSVIRPFSTYHANVAGRRTVERTRSQLELIGKELATGLKADVAKELGMRSSQSIALRNSMDRTEQFIQSNKLTANKFELIADSTNTFQDKAQNFLNLAVSNQESQTPTVKAIQQEAVATMDALLSYMNTSFNGEFVFSGVDSDKITMNAWGETNPSTGYSPEGVMAGIVGAGPTSSGDAATKISEIDSIFDNTNTVNPGRNFEGTFFNGTTLLDGGGNPNPRKEAVVTESQNIKYGIQANDEQFREIFKGLAMLASTDVSEIDDPQAYQSWMREAVGSIASGISGINESQARLGKQQEYLDDEITRQEDKKSIYNNRIVSLEYADPYEAATKLQSLQTQLDATYATTARLSKLSFLNYM